MLPKAGSMVLHDCLPLRTSMPTVNQGLPSATKWIPIQPGVQGHLPVWTCEPPVSQGSSAGPPTGQGCCRGPGGAGQEQPGVERGGGNTSSRQVVFPLSYQVFVCGCQAHFEIQSTFPLCMFRRSESNQESKDLAKLQKVPKNHMHRHFLFINL